MGCSSQFSNSNNQSRDYCADLVAKALSVNYSVRGSFECYVAAYSFASKIRGHGNDSYLENTVVDKITACGVMMPFSGSYFYKAYLFSGVTETGILMMFVDRSENWKVNTYLAYFNSKCTDVPAITNMLQGNMNG